MGPMSTYYDVYYVTPECFPDYLDILAIVSPLV